MLAYLRILTTLCFLLISSLLWAQSEEDALQCATDELHQKLRTEDPAYGKNLDELERAWSKAAKQATIQKANSPPFILPIVFHIVHQNGPENISNGDIQRSLDFTNQAFSNTDYYDQGTGVPTNIEFCLARRDPDNQATNGINRIVSPLTDLDTDNDRDLKDLSRWRTRDYVNVWVVKEICGLGLGCGVAGYAYYPGAHGGRVDGIVVEARWLAGNEAKVGVLIHELGHYLGLRHTFDGGCTNDDCTTDGDRVCDTPPDQSKAALPCTGTANSCTTDTDSGFATDQNDMFINYMDYGYFSCYSAFTAGQRERMHFFLDGRRQSLLESLGCQNPCPSVVDANFSGGDVTIAAGTTINFTNLSSNGDTYSWSENGITFSSNFNTTRLFDRAGTFTIRLTVESNSDLCLSDFIEQRVTVTCDIDAGFTPPSVLETGQVVVFVNTSSNQTGNSWTVDDVVVSTDLDLNYTFDSPGIYTVCLEVDNGFCEDQSCRQFFVRNPPCTGPGCPGQGTDTCTAAFVQSYITPDGDIDGEFTTVLPRFDGQFVGGRLLNSPIVMSLADDGTPIWQTQLFPSGGKGIILEMILDDAGMLAGIGRTELQQGGITHWQDAFIFRMDPADGSLLWTQSYSYFQGVDFRTIVQPGAGENYTLIGALQTPNSGTENGCFLRVSPVDGSIAGTPRRLDASGLTIERAVYDEAAGVYHVTGSESIGSTVGGLVTATLDVAGEVQQSSLLNISSARGLFYDLVQDSDGNLIFGTDHFSPGIGNGLTTHLFKTNTLGEVLWTRYFSIGTSSLPIRDLAVNDTGYLILANARNIGLVLVQTDPQGNVMWARAYAGTLADTPVRTERMFTTSSNIYLAAGVLRGNKSTPTLLRLAADGSSTGDCLSDELIDVNSTPVEVDGSDLDISVLDLQLQGDQFGWEPGFLVVDGESCREPCDTVITEAPDSCGNQQLTFNYTRPDTVGRVIFTAIVTDGTDYFVGGRANNTVPYVAKIDGDGNVIWEYIFFTPPFDQAKVTALIIDRDGMLMGITKGDLDNIPGVASLVFRMDPTTGNILWSKQLFTGIFTKLNAIIDPQIGDDIVVSGRIITDSGDGSSNGLIRLNRETGEVNGRGQLYPPGETDGFIDMVYHPESQTFYGLSNWGVGTDQRVLLHAINFDGSQRWVREVANRNGTADIAAHSIRLVEDKLYILSQEDGGVGLKFQINQVDLAATSENVWERRIENFLVAPHGFVVKEGNPVCFFYVNDLQRRLVSNEILFDENNNPINLFGRDIFHFDRTAIDPFTTAIVGLEEGIAVVSQNSGTNNPVLEILDDQGKQASGCTNAGQALLSGGSGLITTDEAAVEFPVSTPVQGFPVSTEDLRATRSANLTAFVLMAPVVVNRPLRMKPSILPQVLPSIPAQPQNLLMTAPYFSRMPSPLMATILINSVIIQMVHPELLLHKDYSSSTSWTTTILPNAPTATRVKRSSV